MGTGTAGKKQQNPQDPGKGKRKQKAMRFVKLLIESSWHRVIRTICNVDRWLLFLQILGFNAVYIGINCAVLFLIFRFRGAEILSLDPFSLLTIVIHSLFMLSILSLFVIGMEEAFVRSVLSKDDPGLFDTMFDIQMELQNILMGLLSVLAIVAAVYSSISEALNRILLFGGIILFASVVVTSLYNRLFLREHVVEGLLLSLQNDEDESGAVESAPGEGEREEEQKEEPQEERKEEPKADPKEKPKGEWQRRKRRR